MSTPVTSPPKRSPELCTDSRSDLLMSPSKSLKRKATPRKVIQRVQLPPPSDQQEELETPIKLVKRESPQDEPLQLTVGVKAEPHEESSSPGASDQPPVSEDFMRSYLAMQNAMQQQWSMYYLQAALEQQKRSNGTLGSPGSSSSGPEQDDGASPSSLVPAATSSPNRKQRQPRIAGVNLSRSSSAVRHTSSCSSQLPKTTTDSSSDLANKKNYKNMTRERRIEANARERSRVHTISAAFEALRRAVPLYSANQKVSKLAVLRVACQYILALARLAGLDYSSDQSNPSFGDCIEALVQTIQTEGKIKRKL